MADDERGSGVNGGMLTRDWLARIDGKLDGIIAEQAGHKLELALTKARVNELEKDEANRAKRVDKLESRFGSVLSGVGVGLFAAAVYFVRDVTGGT